MKQVNYCELERLIEKFSRPEAQPNCAALPYIESQLKLHIPNELYEVLHYLAESYAKYPWVNHGTVADFGRQLKDELMLHEEAAGYFIEGRK